MLVSKKYSPFAKWITASFLIYSCLNWLYGLFLEPSPPAGAEASKYMSFEAEALKRISPSSITLDVMFSPPSTSYSSFSILYTPGPWAILALLILKLPSEMLILTTPLAFPSDLLSITFNY